MYGMYVWNDLDTLTLPLASHSQRIRSENACSPFNQSDPVPLWCLPQASWKVAGVQVRMSPPRGVSL